MMLKKLLSLIGCKLLVFFRFEVVVHYFRLKLPETLKRECNLDQGEDKKQIDDNHK